MIARRLTSITLLLFFFSGCILNPDSGSITICDCVDGSNTPGPNDVYPIIPGIYFADFSYFSATEATEIGIYFTRATSAPIEVTNVVLNSLWLYASVVSDENFPDSAALRIMVAVDYNYVDTDQVLRAYAVFGSNFSYYSSLDHAEDVPFDVPLIRDESGRVILSPELNDPLESFLSPALNPATLEGQSFVTYVDFPPDGTTMTLSSVIGLSTSQYVFERHSNFPENAIFICDSSFPGCQIQSISE